MTKPTATPRCPTCNAQGIKHLVNHNLGQYFLVYCGQCGAIYGVVPNMAALQSQPAVIPPAAEVPAPVPVPPPFKLAPLPPPPPQPVPKPAPPENPAPARNNVSPATSIAPDFLAEIGYADLTHKIPYDPAKIAARMKAAGIAQGTQYRRFAIDEGPPACPAHRTDMQRIMVPDGYPNRGRWFWVCLQPGCRNWELAE